MRVIGVLLFLNGILMASVLEIEKARSLSSAAQSANYQWAFWTGLSFVAGIVLIASGQRRARVRREREELVRYQLRQLKEQAHVVGMPAIPKSPPQSDSPDIATSGTAYGIGRWLGTRIRSKRRPRR